MMRVKATNESDFTSSCCSWALNSHAHTIRLFLHPSDSEPRFTAKTFQLSHLFSSKFIIVSW